MTFNSFSASNISKYKAYLEMMGSLSGLFSDEPTPYLYYRISEKIYCLAFEACDMSRSDIALDASINKIDTGIGIKTFLRKNNKTFQKIAEFNKAKNSYDNLKTIDLIYKIAELRNERIEFAKRVSGVTNTIYHCIVRDKGVFKIFEEPMHKIDLSSIKIHKENKHNNIYNFCDAYAEYKFNLSKSTLLKQFNTNNFLANIKIKIIDNPLEYLLEILTKEQKIQNNYMIKDTIFLPLYGKNYHVHEKSGLNQWNASGRKRHYNEIYIPIPQNIHKVKPNFFPAKDQPFNLILPNNKLLSCKVCQDNSKALMSNPNKELGKWLLRDILDLKEGELLTTNKLEEIGIDSVRLEKIDSKTYTINFSKLDSYEKFITETE